MSLLTNAEFIDRVVCLKNKKICAGNDMNNSPFEILTIPEFDRNAGVAFQARMVRLGKCGLTIQECGDYFGLDPKDWAEWCEENPIAEARLKCGKAQAIAAAGEELLSQIELGKINAVIFYLKTQANFTEKSAVQIEESLKVMQMPVVPTDAVEAAKVYQQFMRDS
jgi:hypothetical protein